MKRVREIDLEAPIIEYDDDGEEDGDSYTSSWDARSPTKKSRWMHPHESDAARGISFSGFWPRDLDIGLDINGEARDVPERHKTHHDIGETLFSRSTPFAGIDLQLAIPSTDSPESKHDGEVNVQQVQENHHFEEPEPALLGNSVEETVDSGTSIERSSPEVHLNVKTKALSFPGSAADMLYPSIVRQDDKIHSVLEKQCALLHHAEVDVRLEAARIIGGRLGSVKESTTRNLLVDSMQQRLWKEVDLSVNVALVKLLGDTAVMCCADDRQQDSETSVQMVPAQSIALILLQYMKAKDMPNSPMNSALKLQILRAFYVIIEKSEEIVELDALQGMATDQLASPNPRFREWGIRLLVASVGDGRAESFLKKGGLEKNRIGLPGHLKGWNVGQSLMRSLLNYTRDPHPSVREQVVSGLINLHRKGFSLDNDTYKHAVALFKDSFEGVRRQAIRLAGLCAKELLDGPQSNIVDNAFLRVCSMMTDMSVSVKQEVCNTLGEMTRVSDSLMLQSLSKKVLTTPVADQQTSPVLEGELYAGILEEKNLLSWSAGAFAVALEDEFWEVRLAAVKALAKLGIASAKMASGALELMVDMINDDSSCVRHETIQSLASLARAVPLVINQSHLHMFQGVLEDANVDIRKAGHDLLSSIRLPSISAFQETIRAVLTSLEKHPEDEESLFTALEKLGLSHAGYTECIVSELLQELRGLLNKESGLDDPQCVGILVLILAAATSDIKVISRIPPHILGLRKLVSNRFKSSLPSLVVQPLGFKSMHYTWFSKTSPLLMSSDSNELRCTQLEQESPSRPSYEELLQKHTDAGLGLKGFSEKRGLRQRTPSQEQTSPPIHRRTCLSQAEEEAILSCVRHILSIALNSSPLLEVGAFRDVLQKLSGCRKELKVLKEKCLGLHGAVTFCGVYLNCLEVVVKILGCFSNQITSHEAARKPGLPQDLLRKLEHGVKHLMYRFLGLNYDQLCQIYDLYALVLLWKLVLHPKEALSGDRASSVPLQGLRSIIRASKRTSEDERTSPSTLLRTVQEHILNEEGNAKDTSIWRCAREVALSYWPGDMSVVASINEVWADMKVPGPDFDHRIEFVPGLPLGISVDITLHNLPESSSLWIQFALDSSAVQYRYIDVGESQIGSAFNVRRLSTVLHLDNMQAGASCVSRICIVLEGMEHQGNHLVQGMGRGPKGTVVPLCNEKEANLVNVLIKERSSKLAPPIRR